MPRVIYDCSMIDFDQPGKHHYQVAFPLDSSWGYSLVPLTVINGLRRQGPGAGAPGVAAFGGTHGNEWEGQVAVKRLCQDLDPEEMCGRVILIPQLSESACVNNTRVSPLDGVNMNRAFPGNPRGTVSSRIANFVNTCIFPQVGVVLDIHSGGNEGVFPICTSFHPIADPVQRAEMARVAQLFDTPFVLIYSSQMASGLLTDEAEAQGKVTIGGEFGFAESVSVAGTRHAYEGIRNVLRHYGILPGEMVQIDRARAVMPQSPGVPGGMSFGLSRAVVENGPDKLKLIPQGPPRLVEAPNLEDYVACPADGVWEPVAQLGADVEAGELLGRLHDFSDHSSPAREIRAHRSGVVAMMYFPARVKKGLTLYMIAQEAQP